MNEKRFTFDYEVEFEIFDRVTKKHYDGTVGCQEKICDLLNEQQATIRKLQDLCGESDGENAKLRIENKKLKEQLKQKEQEERLYANEILKLNKEAKEVLDFKSLGGDY